MSTIEANAKPILQELLYARGRTLERGDKRKLATSAFLKACMFAELHPEGRVVAPRTSQGLKLGRDGLPDPEEPNIDIVTSTPGALNIQVAGSLRHDSWFDGVDYPA